jgi:hypothetical protein
MKKATLNCANTTPPANIKINLVAHMTRGQELIAAKLNAAKLNAAKLNTSTSTSA